MPNISTLSYAPNFRLDLEGVTQPLPTMDGQVFRESVKQLLSAQFQQYTDPVQQKLLSQLSEDFSTIFGYENIMTRGYVMEHQEDTHQKIEHNNLKSVSPKLFSLMGIRNETVAQCFGQGMDIDKQIAALNTVKNKNFDAISIAFSGNPSGSGHALALLKQVRDYLLVDSNHIDPITLTLSQLTDFFTTGSSKSTILDELMQKRNLHILVKMNGYSGGT